MEIPRELVDQIARGNCIVFVGAGFSQGAKLPNWPDLLKQMVDWSEKHGVELTDRKEVESYIDDGELLLVANEMRERLGKDDFRRFMVEVFRKQKLTPTDTHMLLPNIPFASALTSNYDTLLESAYIIANNGTTPHVFTHSDYPELSGALRSGEFYVLKVHGTIDRIETIILGQSDYREVMHANSAYRQHLKTLFSTKTVVFLGFGLTDPDLMIFLDELKSIFKDYTGKHYSLMNTKDVPGIKQKRFERDYGIKIIPYTPSTPEHPEVKTFLIDLAEQVRKAQTGISSVVPVDLTPLEELVAEVRTWLQAIRYKVEEPQQLDERKVGMIASMDLGTVKQNVLVYCIGGEIASADVLELRGALNLKTPQGWLISDKRISQKAVEQASSDESVRVFNLANFLQQMVWGPYFDALTSLVQRDRIQDLYVDLDCYKVEVDEKGNEIGREQYTSLDTYIDDWLKERGKMHISILGEFGAGKTWFCRHYAYRQLKRYLKDPAHERLPLLITLRGFTKMPPQQLINEAMLEQYKLQFVGSAFEVFKEMNRRGKLLLILDGFDEMARQVDYQALVDNLWELAKLVDDNSKVILTSRTEYFRRAKESETVLAGKEPCRWNIEISPPKFEVLHIRPFIDEQIRKVILLRKGEKEGYDVAERILNTHNLAEMARKPILVELLLAVLDEASVDFLDNPTKVYLYATNKLLLRNINTKRTFTTTSDKIYFLCELAWEMIKSGELRIHYKAIPERIKTYFREQIKDDYELDVWDFDLRNQTLLHRNAAGYYEFAYKSLAEYFVAFKFAAELGCLAPIFTQTYCEAEGKSCKIPIEQKGITELAETFGTISINNFQMWAIRDLLKEMVAKDAMKRLWEVIKETKGKTTEQVKHTGGNAATLLNLIGGRFVGRNLEGTVLLGADLSKTDLTGTDLTCAILDEAELVRTNLKGLRCTNTSFRNAYLLSTIMEQTIFDGADFTGAKIEAADCIYSLSYSPNGSLLASGGDRRKIPIWDVVTGKEILCCNGHDKSVQIVLFSPKGELLASGGGDGNVSTWDPSTGEQVWSRKVHMDFVRDLSFDPTGKWLASISDDGKLVIWETRTGEKHLEKNLNLKDAFSVSFSPDGNLLAIGAIDGTLIIWDTLTDTEVKRWHAYKETYFVTFSSDSKLLISTGVDDIIDGTYGVDNFSGLPSSTPSSKGSIKIWEIANWQNKLCISFEFVHSGLLHWSVSPTSSYIAGRLEENDVAIWNYLTNELVFQLKGHYANIFSAIFSPDGNCLASSSRDGIIRIWDVNTGKCINLIVQGKDCSGAIFEKCIGLDDRYREWLKDRGATIVE